MVRKGEEMFRQYLKLMDSRSLLAVSRIMSTMRSALADIHPDKFKCLTQLNKLF